MKTYQQRINNLKGQLDGISAMIDKKADSFETITQIKAAKAAFNSLMVEYVQDNFWNFISDCSDKEKYCRKFLTEIINSN